MFFYTLVDGLTHKGEVLTVGRVFFAREETKTINRMCRRGTWEEVLAGLLKGEILPEDFSEEERVEFKSYLERETEVLKKQLEAEKLKIL